MNQNSQVFETQAEIYLMRIFTNTLGSIKTEIEISLSLISLIL